METPGKEFWVLSPGQYPFIIVCFGSTPRKVVYRLMIESVDIPIVVVPSRLFFGSKTS